LETQVRVSVSGPAKGTIKRSVGDLLVTMGFVRRGNGEFARGGNITPEEARRIIDGSYDIEADNAPSRIVTLHILSELIVMIIRRHRHRSI
jgi:hypothetical protein